MRLRFSIVGKATVRCGAQRPTFLLCASFIALTMLFVSGCEDDNTKVKSNSQTGPVALGGPDTSFANNGYMGWHATPPTDAYSIGKAVAIQNNGQIVVAGSAAGAGDTFTVWRFNSNGTRDLPFGPNGDGTQRFNNGSGNDVANAVAVQADQMLMVSGRVTNVTSGTSMRVLRLQSDGTLDPAFSSVTDAAACGAGAGALLQALGIAIQPDGKVVVVGQADTSAAIWRFLTDGTFDSSFNGGVPQCFIFSGTLAIANAVQLDASGRIVVTGESVVSGVGCMFVLRLLTTGGLDAAFNSTATPAGVQYSRCRTVPTNVNDSGEGLALDSSGRVLVSGFSQTGAGDIDAMLWRFNVNGTPDATFGSGSGFITLGNLYGTTGNQEFHGVAVDNAGHIVAVGEGPSFNPVTHLANNPATTGQDGYVVRLNADGSLDNSFAMGIPVMPFSYAIANPFNDIISAIQIDTMGRIVLAGESDIGSGTDLSVWRMQ